MAANKTVMAILFVCDMRRAYGTPSVASGYPALKRWARLRRPLRGLCLYFPHQIFQDISRCRRVATLPRTPQQPSTYVLGYRDNVASRLEKSKTPTSAKQRSDVGTFKFLLASRC